MIIIKVFFISFGCKVNLYETENMKENFIKNGFIVTDEKNKFSSDIFVINSCTVTSMSDKKLRQTIHVLKKIKPSSIVVLTGCFPQAFADKACQIEQADIICGSKDRYNVVNLVNNYISEHQRILSINDYSNNDHFESMINCSFEDKTRAFVKIQDGCNQFCSYCIIPKARGRIRSKPINDIKKEVTALSASGYKEVVLVGINLSFYGAEFGLRLIDAIECCCGIPGIERVRLGSLEPEVISDEDIKRMAVQKKLCPQFHLSLQSGCNKTLKEMNRKYTSEEYYKLVTKLRNTFSDCAITTDIMVGFPGETDEDFKKSAEFIKKICFSHAHIFPYSIRTGTVAADRKDQIQPSIKTKRAKIMAEISQESQQINLQKQVGKIVPVLFEKENCTEFHHGYAPNYTLVKIIRQNPLESLRRQLLYVKIIKYDKNFCFGELYP